MLEIGPNNNTIEFTLQVENTTIDKIKSRLVIEVGNSTTLIPLESTPEGNVKSSIDLKEEWEGKTGTVKLEIINEGNYYVPFEKQVAFKNINPVPKSIVKEVKTAPIPKLNTSKAEPKRVAKKTNSKVQIELRKTLKELLQEHSKTSTKRKKQLEYSQLQQLENSTKILTLEIKNFLKNL